jgi:GTP pyrophosphokinase
VRGNDGAVTDRTVPPQLTERFTKAVDYARTLHAHDVRKGTAIPYLSHVLGVAAIVLEHGGTEDHAIAALLHDLGEDHGGRERVDAIRGEFGDLVADIVEACSDDLPAAGEEKRPWRERKTQYIAHLASASPDAVLVSAADKLHNARALLADYRQIGEALWRRFNAPWGRTDTLWYYESLVAVITERLPGSSLAAELAATLTELGALVAEKQARGSPG